MPPPVDIAAARAAATEGRITDLLGVYGITVDPAVPVRSADEAVAAAGALGWPVALKATARGYRHRPELRGVRLDLADEEQLRAAFDTLSGLTDPGLVVQRMAPPGVAVTVGAVEDPVFGPLVSFGVAGVATDLLGDRAYRILPLSDVDAAELVRSVRAAPLLFGYRASPPVDVQALEELLLRVARLADELPAVYGPDTPARRPPDAVAGTQPRDRRDGRGQGAVGAGPTGRSGAERRRGSAPDPVTGAAGPRPSGLLLTRLREVARLGGPRARRGAGGTVRPRETAGS